MRQKVRHFDALNDRGAVVRFIRMSIHSNFELSKCLRLALGVGFLLIAAQGCDDDDGKGGGAPATPTPTATASPIPTEEPHPPHTITRVGSTQAGGGKLTIDENFTAFVVPEACLGGTGDDCEGGTIVYIGDSPGFNNLQTENPAQPIYKLPDGVTVNIEVTAIDAGASLGISGMSLDAAGEIGLVNTTPELHNHPEWTLVAPGGTHPEDKHITYRLLANGFAASDEITVTLSVFEGEGGDGHDDDD